ncbi:MAG: right-handed parallel beta-helix repeat-containing protein [Candidatus Schekmanbacteria bacterium]|nr:right-handed parallel beta-helix repeat-containing protein [Candidatus Schekmanbacteria bacterium]
MATTHRVSSSTGRLSRRRSGMPAIVVSRRRRSPAFVSACLLLAGVSLTACTSGPALPPPAEASPEPRAFLGGAPFPALTLTRLPGQAPPYLGAPSPRRELFAAPSLAGPGDGSRESPWTDLRGALRRLEPGDHLTLLPGVWTAAMHLDEHCRNGLPEAPIRLSAAPRSRLVPPEGARFGLFVERSFWAIDGIEVSPTGAGTVAVLVHDAQNVHLSRCFLHDGKANGLVIGPGARNVTVEQCEISGFQRGSADAHGVTILPATTGIRLENNHVHHNSGDSVQIVGPEQLATDPFDPRHLPLKPARDITVRGNRMHEDRENAVDIKTATDVEISQNRIWGYRPSSGSRFGEAVVVHYGATNVTVRENLVAGAHTGIVVDRGTLAGQPAAALPRQIVLERNYLRGDARADTAIFVIDSERVEVLHNVIEAYPTALVFLGRDGRNPRHVAVNNLAIDPSRLAFRASRLADVARFEHNVFALSGSELRCRVGRQTVPLRSVLAEGLLPATVIAGSVHVPGGDLDRIAGVSVIDRGAPIPGRNFLGAAPDIGIAEH